MTDPLDGPPPPNEPPEDAYGPASISSMQHVSQSSVGLGKTVDIRELLDMVGASFLGSILSGFESIGAAIGKALEDLGKALFGDYDGPDGPLIAIQDGQAELRNKVLLLGESGYAAAYMSRNYKLGRAKDRALPFDSQIGPVNDATIVEVTRAHPGEQDTRSEWCIRIDRAGLWQAQTTFSHVGGGFADGYAEIVVLRPDLTVYSQTTLPFADAHNSNTGLGVNNPRTGLPVNIMKMFVVPTAGFYVQVRIRFDDILFPTRTTRGGARLSQFSVTQWSEDIDHADTDEDAIGTIVEE